jgi:carboxylesterase type B
MNDFLALTILIAILVGVESQLAQTQYGMIQGRTLYTETERAYYSFQRIPYARPPIGALRFRVSSKDGLWSKVVDL